MIITLAIIFMGSAFINSAKAVDPPYQSEIARLSEMLGSLYFLQPLCGINNNDWRAQAAKVISLERATTDRKQRLTGSFNKGYQSYATTYRNCTPSAKEAMIRLLKEAEIVSRYINNQFAE